METWQDVQSAVRAGIASPTLDYLYNAYCCAGDDIRSYIQKAMYEQYKIEFLD